MPIENAPDFIKFGPDDPDYRVPVAPVRVKDALYMPAHEWSMASVEDRNSRTHGMLLMRVGNMGLNVAMTPAALRETARRMVDIADTIEADAKVKAEAAIARATEKSRK